MRSPLSASTTRAYPSIHFVPLELPEPTDLVARQALVGHPDVDGVSSDTEVCGDLVDGQPAVCHYNLPRSDGPE
jgi:hypothetical protein